jgi:putative SOS response-associated peptidase YedK
MTTSPFGPILEATRTRLGAAALEAGLPRPRSRWNLRRWRMTAEAGAIGDRSGPPQPPYATALADRCLLALAGLWETWRSPAGERVRSFAIITTTPNELCAELHNRMPMILKPEGWPVWLGEQPADPPQLKALMAPYPA